MANNLLVPLAVIGVVAIISGVFTYLRSTSLTSIENLATKSLAAIRRELVIFYGIVLPVVVGVLSLLLYQYIQARWPETAQTTFLPVMIGIAVILQVMAAVVFKMRGFGEFAGLHVLYVAAFGWLMPKLLCS